MRLVQATVRNYRSIDDSGAVEIGPITALVGKNESGKTAFLQALYKFNPVDPGADYNAVFDYPSKGYAQHRARDDRENDIVVEAVFELTDAERGRIEEAFGPGVLTSSRITVTRQYGESAKSYVIPYDEGSALRHVVSTLDLPYHLRTDVEGAGSFENLHNILGARTDLGDDATALWARLDAWREHRFVLHLIDEYLPLPKFLYFDDYSVMPGRASLADLQRKRDAGRLRDSERTLLALLITVGARPEDFQDQGNFEQLTRELEAAANAISDEVFEYWSQNRELAVRLSISNAEAGASPPLDQGPILNIRIHDQRHRVTIPFDERSRGFVWFFSFFAYFSAFDRSDEEVVLLLDEPGLSLHASAQSDFLRLIDERLARKHQVIYTTHSPFMVEADHLDRVRVVLDSDGEGTKVSSDIFSGDRDTVFPLQAALAYNLAQTLFAAPNCLLVAGPADLLYLQILDDALRQARMQRLDPHWVTVPVGGADRLASFVSLLGGRRLNVAVLRDVAGAGDGEDRAVHGGLGAPPGAVVDVGGEDGRPDADIEDLFDPDFYVALVNRAYASELTYPLTVGSISSDEPRIVKRLEDHFAQHGVAGGVFSRYRPAAAFLGDQVALIPSISEETLERVEQLFRRLNALIVTS